MPLRGYNMKKGSLLRALSSCFGPPIIIPVGDTAAIAAAQQPALNANFTLNGLGVVADQGGVELPYPIEPCITPVTNTDVFTVEIAGLDQYREPLTLQQAHASGVVTQRFATTTGNRCFSRIDRATIVAGALTANCTLGWKMAQTADGGASPNKQQRIPLPITCPQNALVGFYIADGGGGTFAAGTGQGAMIKAGIGSFTTGPTGTGVDLTFATYAPDPSVLPTRPVTIVPIYTKDLVLSGLGI